MARMTSTSSTTGAAAPRTPTPPDLAERIGGFLEDIDHPGPVNRAVLARYASVVAAVGAPSSHRYRAAVDLTRRSPDLTPPTGEQLDQYLAVPPTGAEAQHEQAPGAGPRPWRDYQLPPWTRERARMLLEAAGVTDPAKDQVEAYRSLAGAAGEPGLLRWKLAVKLTNAALHSAKADGPVPGRAELNARAKQERQRRNRVANRRRDRLRESAHSIAERDADAAAAYVAAVREWTHMGPTWVELADRLGWQPRTLAELVIKKLTAAGVLTHTPEHRSLDVAPCYQPRTTVTSAVDDNNDESPV